MAAHNSVNGRPCHSSKWLLTDILRAELGCDKCLIGTDFRDIELLSDMNVANTSRYPGLPPDTDASIQALAAGIDQDLGWAYTHIHRERGNALKYNGCVRLALFSVCCQHCPKDTLACSLPFTLFPLHPFSFLPISDYSCLLSYLYLPSFLVLLGAASV